MSSSKRKIPGFVKNIFRYFFVVIGILISLLLTIGIIVNFLELPNQASLLGKFGSKVAEEYYYFFGLPGLIISVFTTIYLPKFFDEKNPTSFLKKFFFIVLLTFSVGGILKIAKTLGGFTQFKIIGFIPSKITEFLVRNITGILGTSIFYGFLIGLSAWQLNFANRFHPLSSARTLLRSIKGWARKAVPSSNEQDEIKINLNDSSDLKISQEQKVGGTQLP